MTFEQVGVFLVFLDIRGEAERLADILDLSKPCVLIVRSVKYFNVFFKYCRRIVFADVFGKRAVRGVKLVVEIGNIILDLVPLCDVLTGLRRSPVDRENALCKICVTA